ncbi:MAG: ribosome-associated translation inhibitor RaiA [Candidatus Poribacteria bacterium]|nr:ribosome-associated translation inhibitor RaiA [Candidatus Poribacteria bacterium]
MKITYSGHQLKITDDLHEYILKRAEKIESRFGEMQEFNVILKAEKHRFEAEVKVNAPRISFYAKNETHELMSALDGAAEKVINQIRRYKERVKDKRHNVPHREVVEQLNPDTSEVSTDIDITEEPTIVPASEKFASKPLTVSEAATELHSSGDSLLMFLNSETRQVNLLYQSDNGDYGWVEPLFM